MSEALQDRADAAVDLALANGADGAWAMATNERSTECNVRNGKLEKMQHSNSRRLSLGLYVAGRHFTHSTNDLRDAQLLDFAKEAVLLTKALEPDPFRELPDSKLFEGVSEADLDAVDGSLAELTPQDRIDRCQALNARTAGKSGVISADSSLNDGVWNGAAASSNGFSGAFSATWVGQYASVTLAGEGDKRPEDGMGASARHMADLPEINWIGDEALRRANARLGSIKGPTMTASLVVDSRNVGRLLGALLGAATGRAVQQGRSFLADKLDKVIFSPKLELVDDPLIARASGSRPFDFEGIAAKPFPIIQGGALRNFFIDTYYGKKLSMSPTSGGSSNLVVTPGKQDQASLIGGAHKGVFVTSWLGGNSDSTSGEFSLGLRGHLIEGGKLGAPVGEMNVTGKLVDLFSRLSAVGSDVWTYGDLRSPSIVFEDVAFSGA